LPHPAEEPGELFAFALAGLPSAYVESIHIMQGLTFSRKAIAALVTALLGAVLVAGCSAADDALTNTSTGGAPAGRIE